MIATLTMSATFLYVLLGLLAIGVLSTGVSLVTQALFTDTAAVGSNTFSKGTIDITTSPTTAMLTISVGAPGSR